jgi:branched-subunit amino acid ABC-type transport system permease component
VQTPQVTNTTGLSETIFVLIGVVVGGMTSLVAATLGGFLIGFANSFLGFELATQGSTSQTAVPFTSSVYLPSVIFVFVILVLLLRPDGLFVRSGRAPVERV